jgi:uncharacterized protein (TIGR02145 family)
MKKNILLALIIFGLLNIISCKKDSSSNSASNITQDETVLKILKNAGVTVYSGKTPPDITGTYDEDLLCNRAVGKTSIFRQQHSNATCMFYNQDAKGNILFAEKLPSGTFAEGLGGIITGTGYYFTVWLQNTLSNGGETLVVFSGKKTSCSCDITDVNSITIYTKGNSSYDEGDWYATIGSLNRPWQCLLETPAFTPTIQISPFTNITSSTADCKITVSNYSDCYDPIEVRVLYTINTILSSTYGVLAQKNDDGTYSCTLTSMEPNTIYTVYAKASSGSESALSSEYNVTTIESNTHTYGTMTDIEGNTYKTIQIGTQVWMAENLRTTKYNDGTNIPKVTETMEGVRTSAYFWGDSDNNGKVNTYGPLYNWSAASSYKTAPTGWHLPSKSEWLTLINYLGGETGVAKKLKEAGYSHWEFELEYMNSTNESGFKALPSGSMFSQYSGLSFSAYYWTSTNIDGNTAYFCNLSYASNDIGIGQIDKSWGFAVRCVKNN